MSNAATEQLAALSDRVAGLAQLVSGINRTQRDIKQGVDGLYKPRADAPPKKFSGRQRFVRHSVLRVLARDGYEPARVWADRYSSRGITNPGSTAAPGWAAELVAPDMADFLLSGPTPALLPQLAALGLSVDVDGPISIPYSPNHAPSGGWIGEGSPIPGASVQLTSQLMVPKKLAVLSSFSAELAERSTPTVETVVGSVLQSDLRRLIDGALVGTQAASPTMPPGLRSFAPGIPAGADMQEDISNLIEALTLAGGTSPIFIVGLLQAFAFSNLPGQFAFPWIVTPELDGDVIVVDGASFVSSVGQPEVRSSESAVVHEESVPLPIGSPPAVVATPSRSYFQTNTIGLRVIARVAWMVAAGRSRWVQGVVW